MFNMLVNLFNIKITIQMRVTNIIVMVDSSLMPYYDTILLLSILNINI